MTNEGLTARGEVKEQVPGHPFLSATCPNCAHTITLGVSPRQEPQGGSRRCPGCGAMVTIEV